MTLIAIPQNALVLKTPLGFSIAERRRIDDICLKIAAFGLLNPLVVKREKGRFVIIDGKKRFQAIKKLSKINKLPRTLNKIPCVLNENMPLANASPEKPVLLTEQDLVHEILSEDIKGSTHAQISTRLECSEKVIAQALSLSGLHSKLKLAFMHNTIDLAQAAALSTLPNKDAQWELLVQLGPFATEPEIIAAIANGETVLELPNGDTIILPSRKPEHHLAFTMKPSFAANFQIAA